MRLSNFQLEPKEAFCESGSIPNCLMQFHKTIAACSLAMLCLLFTSCGESTVDRPEFDTAATASVSAGEGSKEDASVRETSATTGWSRFRGPNGTGISSDTNIPTKWSESENLRWKVELPGAGSSSPILTDDFVFVSSYSGYGEPGAGRGGDAKSLQRHFSCIDRQTGDVVWSKSIDNEVSEDPYSGNGLPEHGYATNTPVTDGKHVYVFFGKTGVIAYDLEGNEKWRKSVGTASGNRRWGSAASLILVDDKLIVNAAEESETIYALSKETGETLWKSEAGALELCYSTPALVKVDDTRSDLVVAVPSEVWGLNPENGKLVWYVKTSLTGNLSPSVIVDGDKAFIFGGYRSKGSLAIKGGGKGDVTDSNVLWTSPSTTYVPTPVLDNDRLYWIDDKGLYHCLDASNGKSIDKQRVSMNSKGGRAVYASPVNIGGKIYAQTRYNGLMVFNPGDKMDLVEQNEFDDASQFNATPAVDSGQLFLRSDKFLYCVEQQKSE